MGDSALSAGMIEFAELLRGVHPGMFIHLIHVEDTLEKDQRAGFVSLFHLITASTAPRSDMGIGLLH